MRRLLASAVSVLALPSAARGQSVVPLAARWPEHVAVGMRQGGQLAPSTVEARRDGWVVVTLLPSRPDEGLEAPSVHLLAEAQDVRRWAGRVRTLLGAAAEAAPNPEGGESVFLGNGGSRLEARVVAGTAGRAVHFTVWNCGAPPSTSVPSRGEMLSFLDLVDSAAAQAGGGRGLPPTLERPYYAAEVSCRAAPAPENARPTDPRGRGDVGVRFVVDTTGAIEAGSVAFLPGTDPRLARQVRAIVRRWRFRPAEWDGAPVRQLVQQRLSLAPPAPLDTGLHAIGLRPEADGWVRFTHTLGTAVTQEWFAPDSIDAWARRVEARYAAGPTAAPTAGPATEPRESDPVLGSELGIRFAVSVFAYRGQVEHRAGLVACAGASTEGEYPVEAEQLERFRAAARAARALRPTPADPARTVHSADDVACPAWLPWHRSAHPRYRLVWRYPTGVYPRAMAASHARAEVLASFVVDTAGRADASTLRVMPGSDPRAVAALPASLGTLRFRPATRGGRRVPQRVIQPIRFEPPPVCASPDAAPACPRRYNPSLDADRRP